MKTTLEIPDALLRCAQSEAASQGISFGTLVCQALTEKLSHHEHEDKPWMKSFGKLRSLRKDSARIRRLINKEFARTS